MIAGIKGILEAKGQDWVQVQVGGAVSFQVQVPSSLKENLGELGDEVYLHTQLQIRDDKADIYGFATADSLQLFNLLNSVSGIGPRTALAILSDLGPRSLVSAIAGENVGALAGVSGVGARTAGRIVLELKGKVAQVVEGDVDGVPDRDGDVVAALTALGYSPNEARKVVSTMGREEGETLEDRIRLALLQIGRG